MATTDPTFLIYGATGYTGRLLAAMAKERGLSPRLSGRNPESLRSVAEPLGFEHRAVSLADGPGLDRLLADVDAVLHAAGPFSTTSRPMVDACLRTGTHYLDITGEIDVFEACAARGAEARDRGVVVLPGVGFDVVPTDCLAAHLHRRMPAATSLRIGIRPSRWISRGTAKTSAESVSHPSQIRRGGRIVDASAPLSWSCDFGEGTRECLAVSWGDVSTAFHSTGIPDVTVYFAAHPQLRKLASLGSVRRWLLSTAPAQAWIKRRIDRRPAGPTEEQRAGGTAIIVAAAENDDGERVASRLRTPDGYSLTCLTGLEIAARVLRGEVEPGFRTPSSAFGPDFILGIDGCEREDLET